MVKRLELYPFWKTVAWRYARIFIDAFVATFAVDQFVFGTIDIRNSILKAAIAAGLGALAKALRENKPYEAAVHKLPL